MITSGGRANKTGRTLESIVVPTLTNQYGFVAWPFKRFCKASESGGILISEPLPKRILIQRVPYTTLYGGKGYTEFLLRAEDAGSTQEFPLSTGSGRLTCRIECKWQQSAGSVDEKFPYLYLSCLEAIEEPNVIILHGGGKYRPGAIQWLKDVVKTGKYHPPEKPRKNIQVMGVEEFMTWVSHCFGRYVRPETTSYERQQL